jgi:sporulation protein YlmC with PRC-barrel domain
MYRAFESSMRIGCAAAIMMFLAGPMVAAGSSEQGCSQDKSATMQKSGMQMNSPAGSESMAMHSQPQSQSKMASAAEPQRAMATARAKYQRLDHVIGRPVYGTQDEKLGHIEDIVLDSRDGTIDYAVLSYGGFLGFRDKLFAVPWAEFQCHPEKDAYVLDVRKEYLKGAPGFAKDRWPNMADENWSKTITAFYREGRTKPAHPGTKSSEPMMTAKSEGQPLPVKYRRASQLIGMSAKDFQGQNLGALDDIVIDADNHTVAYGVVMLDTTIWALEREMALVPWSAIEVVPELSALRIDADESMLKAVAFSPAEEFPYLGDPLYAQRVDRQFEATPYWETLGYVPGESPKALEATRPMKGVENVNAGAWRSDSEYNQRFDPGLVTTVRGTISGIGSFDLAGTSIEGLCFSIKTPEGKTMLIHAGPRPFIESQDVKLHFGDEVTVTGAPSRIAAWRGEFLMASTIQCGNETYRLRNSDGTPRWIGNGQAPSSSSGK